MDTILYMGHTNIQQETKGDVSCVEGEYSQITMDNTHIFLMMITVLEECVERRNTL